MKHFTQTTANGLCTPPYGSSQSKSTRFFILTLLLGLLTLGSTSAWGAYTGNLYIVGTCTNVGWDPNGAQKFDNKGDGIYVWEGYLKTGDGTNGFKFLTARDWNDYFGPSNGTENMSDGAKGYLLDPTTTDNQSMATTTLLLSRKSCNNQDRKWRVTSHPGYYRLTIDLSGDDCSGKMTITPLEVAYSESNIPYKLWYVGHGINVEWTSGSFSEMNKAGFGVFWKKAYFNHTWGGDGAYTFKFMPQNAWGWIWGANSNDTEVDITNINTSGYVLKTQNPDGGGQDWKFKTITASGDRNVVCDFVSESSPKMYVYPSDKIYLDMGGTLYDMAWNESTGNYSCSTEIPASTTFRFCMNSNGTGTFGAASANTEIGAAANDNAKIVRNGTNYYTTPNNKKITGLTLHLATRQLTITSVADVAVIPDVTLETKEYYLTGDLWDVCKNFMGYTKDAEAWVNAGSDDNLPFMAHLQKNGLNTEAQLTFVAPPILFRFDLEEYRGTADYSKLQKDNIWDAENSNVTNNGSSEKHKFNLQDGTYEITIKYTAAGKLTVNKQAYTPTPKVGYKVILDEDEVGTLDSDGAYTIYNMSTGDHTLRISDGTTGKICGINWWGGLYFDKTNSSTDVISFAETTYHGTDASKFAPNPQPVVAKYNSTGKFNLSAESDIRVSFDGGKIVLTATEPAVPAVTRTVTIHPNNGAENFTMDVADGGTISSIAATYGNGIASWYKDAELTQAFTLNSSTVTEDMDLYAKWGVSGNFYLVGDFGMHDKGSNWAYNSGLAMTTTDGVASVTYIAPKGRHRFEILTSRSSWPAIANQGSGLIATSTPTLSWSNEGAGGYYHFRFDLDAPKKVTVRYDGKVSVTAEDYVVAKTGWTVASKSLFGHGSEESPDNADDGAYMNGYNMTEGQMNSDGELVIHNLNAGTYKFWIGKYNTALNKQKQNIEVFGAAHVDKANSSLGDYGSLANVSDDTYNRSIPMDDKLHRRVQFTLNQRASIKIAFDGGKITVNLLPKYTVTFNSNDGSAVASQSVFEGNTASEPSAPKKAGYEFVKWQLSGADYTFSEAVTGNITLDAVWAYKAISSVELNESEHTTWVGNSDFVLTLTKNPSDLIAKSVAWTSDDESVATVSNGTVHVKADAGITEETVVHITCTVTDQYDVSRSAYCDVTVAACEMTTDNLYSMTVTGYNSSTGSSATLNGLWNESSDNTEPATFRIVKLRFQPNNNYISNQNPYAADVNGVLTGIAATNDGSDQWYEIPAGSGNYNTTLYYLKNVKTNRYIVRGSTFHNTGNGEWYYYNVYTEAENPENGNSKWFYDTSTGNTRLICYQGYAGTVAATANDQSGNGAFMIHNGNWNAPGVAPNCAPPALMCGFVTSGNFGNVYTTVRGVEVVDASYDNPNYKASQMNSSYYRMKENATVLANLANGLAYGSVITVRLYADAATSVKLQTAAGDDVETINLSADAAREFNYTVGYGSELVGATAFIIKAADNHAGIASIEVSRMHAVSPAAPALTWDADLSGGVEQSALAGTFQHVASSALSDGAIHYSSSDETVATVAADGTVTPLKAGSTTITATIEAEGCYAEASIPYGVTLTEPTLAELIAADAGAGITLTHNYAEDIVIDKAITIDGGGHTIGNLTVQMAGDLTLSGALTVNDFSIYAKAGNTTTPAASGQVRNATNLTANGNAYFYYTVDPSGHVQYGWYDFTVPFRVNVMTGIKGIQGVLNEDFVNERDYAVMEHLGEKQAAGEYAYKKFRGVMEPCRLYSITLDDDYNYNTIRFQKADGDLVASDNVTLSEHSSSEATRANWNGVGNGTLHHADAAGDLSVGYVQVYQSGNKTFLPAYRSNYSFVIGSAFMVQETGTMTLNQATHSPLLAPKREASVQPTAIQIAREGQPFSDQLFISADETAGQGYTQGVDVAKAGNIGNVNVPQIWTNAYNSKLCAHEAQLINGEASYTLSLYAPANGSYTLTSKNIPEGYTLYLTQNGNRIWDLSERYELDLTKGTATEYGLLLVENYKMPTAVENIGSKADKTQKIMHNGILYILRNGKVFNAQGARVK